MFPTTMTNTARMLAACLVATLWLAGCADEPASVPPPDVDIAQFPEPARDRATALAERLAVNPDDADAAGAMAMLAHAFGLDQAAIELYRRAQFLLPQSFSYSYLLGVVLSERGDPQKATEAFERALAVRGNYAPLILRLGELKLAAGETQAAAIMLRELVDSKPGFAPARLALGRTLVEQGDLDAAVAQLRKAVELVPHYGAAHYALADALQAQGDEELAARYRALFDRNRRGTAPREDPVLNSVDDLRGSAMQATIKAGRLAAAGRFQEAANVFLALLDEEPDNVVAHTNLIGLFGELRQYGRAEQHYRGGIAVAPGDASLHNNFGVLMLKQNRYAEAAEAFQAAVDAEPRRASAHKYLGLSLERLGENERALTSYRAAVYADPLDHQAGYLLGSALLSAGDHAGAIEALSATLEPPNKKTPSYLHKLAAAYFAAGDSEQGRQALERARVSALSHGQLRLADTIDADLARLEEPGSQTP